MKNKTTFTWLTAGALVALGFFPATAVLAESGSSGSGSDSSQSRVQMVDEDDDGDDDSNDDSDSLNDSDDEDSASSSRKGSATSTANRGSDDDDDDSDEGRSGEEGERHRSQVAEQVLALLRVADRDGGIGEDVREIAHEFASSSERSSKEIEDIEDRPGWMIVLIGADYKSLGALRSEVATTQNAINRLTGARDRATDASVKAALDVQITALTETASSTEAFARSHESAFSVFGWFFKLFAK